MDIEKAKKDSRKQIIQNIEDLYVYLESLSHPNNQELKKLYIDNQEFVIDSIGNISILYYVYAYSNNKVIQDKIANEIRKSIKIDAKVKSLFLVYLELIDIQDINPSLTEPILTTKNKQIHELIKSL